MSANVNDDRFVEVITQAEAFVTRAEELLKDTSADPVGAALVAAQLATAHVLAAMARDLTEIRKGMGR